MNEHIDWMYIHQLADGNDEFALELLELFVEDSSKQLKILEEAVLANNLLQMEQVAHYLKGASANVGAIVMQTVAEKLEYQARHHQIQDPAQLLQELTQSLLWIQRYIKVQQF
jgi:HPt (histidine-containing phosphotransfer) domain-containing protein